MASYLLDTNVLLRIADTASVQHDLASQAVAKLIRGGDTCLVTPQVLIEFWVVATRPIEGNGFGWSGQQTYTALQQFLDQFRLLEDIPGVFTAWMAHAATRPVLGKRAHDLRLVAVIDAHAVDHILTFDVKDFSATESNVPVHPRQIM